MAEVPDCTDPDTWPAAMAFTYLKNANLTDADHLDFTKTKVSRLASEEIGRGMYRQIHLVHFSRMVGGSISVITSNEVANEECSMSDVDVYVISRILGTQIEHYSLSLSQ